MCIFLEVGISVGLSKSVNSVSSGIQKGHGTTYHWGQLIMHAGHPVDLSGISNTHPPQIRVQTESVMYVKVEKIGTTLLLLAFHTSCDIMRGAHPI